ncbi:ErmE/ErmH/ErmO/ErmR family 23S rRNA (adenine(2058)-N(6))-methyltransferase [Streptosporangium sp. NPDC087985]|uniref:ErmE/ErmH/ErmO/ErmR family 23S rRNA (adenine(2058)-N(6))-methyltransferase n=1 Tax=Streptosporangium sp. NPDC087985 TaxID=3366196 RepID=UPI0038045407
MAQFFAHGNYSHTQKRVGNGGGRGDRDRARRVFSQNFMIDPYVVSQVVEAAGPHELVLEPGGGEGVLTCALAETCKEVVTYEIDPLLAGRLASRTRGAGRITVVRGDFLRARVPVEPFAVVGNIPYAITSKIVSWCLRAPALTSATLVTQLEYARKRTGDFGRWSLLTVLTWPEYSWKLLERVDRRSFRPVPAVDSAILSIERRPAALLGVGSRAGYRAFVEYGFAGRGGSLHASLRRRYPVRGVDVAFEAAGVGSGTVVAFVHPEQWLILFDRLHSGEWSRR